MTEAVFQFKAIARRLNRQEQKAEFDAKDAEQRKAYEAMGGGMFGIGSPLMDQMGSTEAGRLTGAPFEGVLQGSCSTPMSILSGGAGERVALTVAQLPPYTPSLTSMAHPEWPYQGTGFEWAKFVKVKI
jgi:hypothetical protein